MAVSTNVYDEENNENRARFTPPTPTLLERWRAGWTTIVQSFRRDPRWWFAIVLLLFILAALFAPWISPYSPTLYHPAITAQGPSAAHWLGTDALGRDQLSRVIYGTRISLSVGVVTIFIGGLLGTILGLIAAYSKGWVDQLIAIVIDALLSFPSLILALALVTALGPSIINLAIALAVVRIPIYARISRGQTLQITTQDYVEAARVTGTPTWKILLRHVFPNIFSPLLVQATISISLTILDETVLSFLGLGVQPPTPEWGTMINDAQQYLPTDPWMMVGPAVTIIILLISMNLLGDAVRDRLDPRSQDTISLSTPNQS
ncbi:ABC transporter permease [Dictyobacter formicarum]|uniref:ABC transporter permease n=1 Tax=Dictyobacter formicarum TaxID=2778368 RepID=A0ABQ3VMH0_9CHLR|nr:ABC transporter permease [Dictyobacter formicarum]GHO87407.1 ABC transporter permease [Dictyobacter formicarum]